MNKMIAACGIDCAQCTAYIATINNDNELRAKTAAEWKVTHNFDFTPEMINCHGCMATDGVQIGHCSMCELRKCASEKKASTCAVCAQYPCKAIDDFFAMVPAAKANLEALRT